MIIMALFAFVGMFIAYGEGRHRGYMQALRDVISPD